MKTLKEELARDVKIWRQQLQRKFEVEGIDKENYDKINGTLNEISVLVNG